MLAKTSVLLSAAIVCASGVLGVPVQQQQQQHKEPTWGASLQQQLRQVADNAQCQAPFVQPTGSFVAYPPTNNTFSGSQGVQLLYPSTSFLIQATANVWLAACSEQQYEDYPAPPGFQIIKKLDGYDSLYQSSLYGVVLSRNDTVLVLFRGTQTTSEWITDADFSQVPWSVGGVVPNPPNPLVHAGFSTIHNSFRGELEVGLIQAGALDKGKQVVFFGTSLGGAMATMAAALFTQKFPKAQAQAVLVTACSPRVGNPDFAQSVNNAYLGRQFRIVNEADIVPTLPLPEADGTIYEHVGGLDNTVPVTFSNQTGNVASNHVPSYVQWLAYMASQSS